MADPEYAIRFFFNNFESHPIIANAQTQVGTAFELLDLALAARGVIR